MSSAPCYGIEMMMHLLTGLLQEKGAQFAP